MAEVDAKNIRLKGSTDISIHADVVTWAERQAALLRRIAAGEQVNEPVDWEEIAEEIESVGVSERRSLASHIQTIIEHLAKLEVSPAINPRDDWKDTVLRARLNVADLLEESPSLRRDVSGIVAKRHANAIVLAASAMKRHAETPRGPVELVRYTPEQVTGDWFPSEIPAA